MSEQRILNRFLSIIYSVVALLLCISYLIEVLNKGRTVAYFIVLMCIIIILYLKLKIMNQWRQCTYLGLDM